MRHHSSAYLTIDDVAVLCRVKPETVNIWIKHGHLKTSKVSEKGENKIRIPDLISFLRQNEPPVSDSLRLDPKRVLIVDDEYSMASSIQRALKKYGFETMIATDALQAIALLNTFQPAVMTLDMLLPDIHGMDILKLIRSFKRYQGIHILIISGLIEDDLNKAKHEGADDVLEKPFNYLHLIEKVTYFSKIQHEEKQHQDNPRE